MKKTRKRRKEPFALELRAVLFSEFPCSDPVVTESDAFLTGVELDIAVVGEVAPMLYFGVVANQEGIASIPKPRQTWLNGRTPIKVEGPTTGTQIVERLRAIVDECSQEIGYHERLKRYFRGEYDDRSTPPTETPNWW